MLLSVNPTTRFAEKKPTVRLQSFNFNERDLQEILFGSLDRLFSDDELILIMQSRQGPEEPDIMAVDKDGNLYIFELKAWESQSNNLLQVLRYGQIFGSSKYADLDAWFKKFKKTTDPAQSLMAAHKNLI